MPAAILVLGGFLAPAPKTVGKPKPGGDRQERFD
jgi:hypothetical protein